MIYLDMGRPIEKLTIDDDVKNELIRRSKAYSAPQRDILRANIILLKEAGHNQEYISEKLNISRRTVMKWVIRFKEKGIDGLNDAPGRGRKESIPLEKLNFIITKATQPPEDKFRWSTRTMAKRIGVSATSVNRIWNKNDIKPHIIKTFKLSKDKYFEEKFWDVIGLYLDPPDKALLLCCDEKSQCQALERTQPCLPLNAGHTKTQTHDYYRHGTTTLFAALDYLTGKIISRTEQSHRHIEWLKFLKQINRETPKGLDIHLIIDNYSTHKHEKVRKWLSNHKRFHVHFTPTGSSWMNLVERFFADITVDVIRNGSFTSLKALEDSINKYLQNRNSNPRRYIWKAEGKKILEKINKARKAIGWEQYCVPN